MTSEKEPRQGLTPTRLEATPTFELNKTLQLLFLNWEGKRALGHKRKGKGHKGMDLSLLSRRVVDLNLHPTSEEEPTDFDEHKQYRDTLKSYRERLFQVSLPIKTRDMGSRGAEIGVTLNFGSDWEKSLVVAPPLFPEELDEVKNVPMYIHIQRSHLVADRALQSIFQEFTEVMAYDANGTMQVNHMRVHHGELRIPK